MTYEYTRIFKETEKRELIKAIIPKPVRIILKRIRFKKRYPESYVSGKCSIREGTTFGKNCIVRKSWISAETEIGDFTTIGNNCRFGGKGNIKIGKFCSIAPECLFWSENHNTGHCSTYPFEHYLKGQDEEYEEYTGQDITIGNDVWIGQRAIVLAGANIQDGCIIAAGSVVPQGDYPPYRVIAGSPARIVKRRFAQDKINELLKVKWWDKNEEEIFGELMPFLHE